MYRVNATTWTGFPAEDSICFLFYYQQGSSRVFAEAIMQDDGDIPHIVSLLPAFCWMSTALLELSMSHQNTPKWKAVFEWSDLPLCLEPVLQKKYRQTYVDNYKNVRPSTSVLTERRELGKMSLTA